MSRTYRKFPVIKDNKRHSKKWSRQQANRKIRRTNFDDISNGMHYKKFYEQWDICDHWSYCTMNEWMGYWANWYNHNDLYKFSEQSIYYKIYRSPNWYGVTIHDAITKWKKQYYWK